MPRKKAALQGFCEIDKSPLLIANSERCSLRSETIFGKKPLKIDEKCFLFHLKISFRCQDI